MDVHPSNCFLTKQMMFFHLCLPIFHEPVEAEPLHGINTMYCSTPYVSTNQIDHN